MPKRQRLKLSPRGRFDPDVTASRLEGLRDMAGVTPKEIGSELWPNQDPDDAARSWYKRANKQKGRIDFTLPEIERAVDYLLQEGQKHRKIQARVLPGFPFIDYWLSLRIERGEAK